MTRTRRIIIGSTVLFLLLFVLPIVAIGLAPAGSGRVPIEPEPTPTPDERIEYWAEVLAQRQIEHNGAFVCAVIDQPDGSWGGGDDASIIDQIPSEIAYAVSNRMVEKLRDKCAGQPSATADSN